MLEALEKARNEVQGEIDYCKECIKLAKHDVKKLTKSKAGALEAGIDDYVFDDKIKYKTDIKEKLESRVFKLKKIKYRLDVAKKMLDELN